MAEIDFAAIVAEDAAAQKAIAPAGDTKPADPPAETADPGAASGDEPPAPETTEPPKERKVIPIERLNSEIAKKREFKSRAEKAEAERDALVQRLTQPPPSGDPFEPSKFATLEERDKAVREHARQEALAEVQANEGKKQIDRFWADLDKEGRDIEDFEDTVETLKSDKTFPLSDAMASYLIRAADHRALLGKWLVDNKTETQRIYELSPEQQIKELSRRDGLLGRTVKAVTKAPPPPPEVTGASGGSAQSFEKLSYDDIKKWAKEQQR